RSGRGSPVSTTPRQFPAGRERRSANRGTERRHNPLMPRRTADNRSTACAPCHTHRRGRAANQCQCRQRQQIAVDYPLYGGEVGAERDAQLGQRDREYRTVNKRHRGCKHTGSENYAAAPGWDLAAQLTRTWFGFDHTAAAWINERLRHLGSISECRYGW